MKTPWEQDTDRYPRAWVRWAIFVLWALGISFCVSIVLVACTEGGDDNIASSSPQAQYDGDWFTATDDTTGRTFRCILWWKTVGSSRGGLASFCYEPFTGAGE